MRLALALALVLAGATAAPAQAQILDPGDATELAQTLAEAQAEQGICYGWEARATGLGADLGSSVDGPGNNVRAQMCEQFIVLFADITYVCDSCEGEDFAKVHLVSNLVLPPALSDLEALGFKESDLVSEQDDRALFTMVSALPLLAAEKGAAPPVPPEPAQAVPATDRPTGTPGNDLWRDRWFLLVLSGFLLLSGPAWWLYKRGQLAAAEKDRLERERRRARIEELSRSEPNPEE